MTEQQVAMSSSRPLTTRPGELYISLAHALGYDAYPDEDDAQPFLNYIVNRHIGPGNLDEYLHLFIRVMGHFKRFETIQTLMDSLCVSQSEAIFSDTPAGSTERRESVRDTLMYIMGVWSMMLSSFVQLSHLSSGKPRINLANTTRTSSMLDDANLGETLAGFITSSRLIPRPGDWQQPPSTAAFEDEIMATAIKLVELMTRQNNTYRGPSYEAQSLFSQQSSFVAPTRHRHSAWMDDIDSNESLCIKRTNLNAFALHVLGAVEINWTYNISRHMLITQRRGKYFLDVFALPCVFKADSWTSSVGIPPEFVQEIQESYCILFNALSYSSVHAQYGRWLGVHHFCWCWSCAASRYRKRVLVSLKRISSTGKRKNSRVPEEIGDSEFDPYLEELMSGDSADWTHDLFPLLWDRITVLEEHLQRSKPWSIWILFRDRRDTLQFWTFFFATIVVFLTFLQMVLGIAQVIGTF